MIKEYKLLPFMTAAKNYTTDFGKNLSNDLNIVDKSCPTMPKKGRSSERTIGEVI